MVVRKRHIVQERNGCRILLEASPGAAKTEIKGVNEWRGVLEVRVGAEAREGAANEELIRFLAKRLGVPKKEIQIIKGERSPSKIVRVPLSAEVVEEKLGGD